MPCPDDSRNRREALQSRWLTLTREILPALAAARGWPIRLDHCFQRVFLDHAFGGCWSAAHGGRPAYRTVPDARLEAAVDLAERVVAGGADLAMLNAKSLRWRGKP